MKKTKILLLIATFFTISHLSKAQYNKGSKFWLAEGAFTGSIYSDSSSGDRKYTGASYYDEDYYSNNQNITISYKNASFIAKNEAKGWLLSYNIIFKTYTITHNATTNYTKYTLSETNYNHTFNGGYFIDKYIPISNSLAIYGEILGKVGFSFNSGKGVASAHDIHIGANANVGIRYFINKQLFINGQTSLADISLKSLTTDSKTSTNININSIMTVSTVSIAIGKSF